MKYSPESSWVHESKKHPNLYYTQRTKLSKECNFTDVKANEYRDEAIRVAFISGMISNAIRQRLLENKTLNLEGAVTQARALETAQKNSEVYHSTEYRSTGAALALPNDDTLHESADTKCAAFGQRPRNSQECYFCGNWSHPRYACPAKDATCHGYHKEGQFAKFCQSPPSTYSPNVAAAMPKLASITCRAPSCPITASVPNCVKQAQLPIINNVPLVALVDSGSSENFIDYSFCIANHLQVERKQQKIGLAAGLNEAETWSRKR